MPWFMAGSHEYLIAALQSDIVRELRLAGNFLHPTLLLKSLHDADLRRAAAACAAAALSNATVLAAEIVALGGDPPPVLLEESSNGAGPAMSEAQASLRHYARRMAMARRFGLERLQEVFRNIVRSKREHLHRAAQIARAGGLPAAE